MESRKDEEESQALELTDDEKLVLILLKANSPVDLNELKGLTGLINKKWDIAIKGLRSITLQRWKKPMRGCLWSWFKEFWEMI